MFLVDQLILLAGVLLLIGILSSKASLRLGLPVLVLFLIVGMLAGEEGVGRIEFDNFTVAHAIGTWALAVILFDGGLRTDRKSLRLAWKPAMLLATGGVLVTALVTGAAAAFVLDTSLLTGLLLGSIVASTDAAAVFSVLRSQGVRLRPGLAAILEVESGSNDPMAIFLTIGLIEILLGRMEPGLDLLRLFVLQMGVGAASGLAIGWVAVRVIGAIRLETAGLYPVLTGANGLLAYGVAAALGGSGFLAIYIAGIVLGNGRIVFQRGTFLFLDGLAWMSQITMFVMLGLLSTPSELVAVAPQGLGIAAVLIFLARPVAVFPFLAPLRFKVRELLLISWVGLKGAVPIILATFPLLLGVPQGMLIFNVVFFVVLVSAVVQGWSLPFVARKLRLQQDAVAAPPVTLEITALADVNADIVDYTVGQASSAAGRRLSEIALPEGAVVALIARGPTLIPARGSTEVVAGDHVFVILRPTCRSAVDEVFGARG